MKRTLALVLCSLALIAGCGKDAPTAPSQPPEPAKFTLSGTITDKDTGQPLASAYVRLFNNAGSSLGSQFTDGGGNYSIGGVVAGAFRFNLSKVGYLTSEAGYTLSGNMRLDATMGIAPPPVEYRITGTARTCSATYENSTGGTNQQTVAIPFSYTWSSARSGDFLYMSCQINQGSDTGTITVSIYKNGSLYRSGFAAGFPNIATASGSY